VTVHAHIHNTYIHTYEYIHTHIKTIYTYIITYILNTYIHTYVHTDGKENEITKWQEQWTSSTKEAVSKLFVPYIKERMMTMIPISAEFRLW